MSFLSSKAESELLPLLYSVKPLGAFLEKAEQLLGTPIRFCPGGNMYAPMESPSYPHEDTLHVLHYLSGGLDAQRPADNEFKALLRRLKLVAAVFERL